MDKEKMISDLDNMFSLLKQSVANAPMESLQKIPDKVGYNLGEMIAEIRSSGATLDNLIDSVRWVWSVAEMADAAKKDSNGEAK